MTTKRNLLLISADNDILYKNYKLTVENSTNLEKIKNLLPNHIAIDKISVWGFNPTTENVDLWNTIQQGDLALFFRKKIFFSKATVLYKLKDESIAGYLWSDETFGKFWEYLVVLGHVQNINLGLSSAIPFLIDPLMPQLFTYPIKIVNQEKVSKLIEIFGSLEKGLDHLSKLQTGVDNNTDVISKIDSKIANSIPRDVKLRILKGWLKLRQGQTSFRKNVIRNYNQKCAICDIDREDLLEASHIIPVNNQKLAGLLENGICFCVLHHAMFDRGYFSLDEKYRVIISKNKKIDNEFIKLITVDGKSIFSPKINPSKKYLEFHRLRFGFG
ncbi:MAG TPA: HNH endonuclease [Nitrososphaeraceae archaeon]|nr:HNH endonuclease [Nitrososphaeraceae archaeon]